MLDEPATAFALAGFLLRALDCGAVDAAEVHAAGGPDEPALRRLARRTAAACAAGRAVRRRAARGAARGVRVAALGRRGGRGRAVRRRRHAAGSRRAGARGAGRARHRRRLAGHPRIGERSKHASSALEQAGVGDDVRAALAAGNREYEARFGHVYLVAASGRTGEELLADPRRAADQRPGPGARRWSARSSARSTGCGCNGWWRSSDGHHARAGRGSRAPGGGHARCG